MFIISGMKIPVAMGVCYLHTQTETFSVSHKHRYRCHL